MRLEGFVALKGSITKAAAEIGVPFQTLNRWLKGKSLPQGLSLRRLADLGITKIGGLRIMKIKETVYHYELESAK